MKIENTEETISKIVNCGLNNVLTENDVIELLQEVDILRKSFDLSCEEWGAFGCCKEDIKHDCDKDCSKHWRDLFVNEVKRRINND